MDRKKIPKDFEENRTRVEPLLNETPPTLPTLLSAAKLESRLPYTIGSDPRRHRFVRWSDGSDSGSMGYVGDSESRANWEALMVGFLAGYIWN